MEMGALSLCFPEGDGGTEGVRWLGVVVGGSFVSLDFVFVSRTVFLSVLFTPSLCCLFFWTQGTVKNIRSSRDLGR